MGENRLAFADQELYRSCRVLFGDEVDFSGKFLENLEKSWLRRAFRQKAFETHPDLAGNRDEVAQRLRGALFMVAHKAYKSLADYLGARDKAYMSVSGQVTDGFQTRPAPAGPVGQNSTRTNRVFRWDTKTIYRGAIPGYRLMFGNFLYYTGVTDWYTIAQALIWQRSQRLAVGRIALELGWLSEADITRILRARQDGQLFGQTALEMGALTEVQIEEILARQQGMHKKIGGYFIAKKILSPEELEGLLARYEEHNAAFVDCWHRTAPPGRT